MNDDESSVQEMTKGFDPRVLFANGLELESADLLVGGPTDQTIGRISAQCFLAFKNQSGVAIFDSIAIVAPPLSVWPKSDDEMLVYVQQGVVALAGEALNEQQIEYVRKRFIIYRCPDLASKGLLDKIKQLKRSLVIVPMAHVYRDVDVVEIKNPGVAAVRLAEHTWVPHLAAWSESVSGR